jgi:hypothetical protein
MKKRLLRLLLVGLLLSAVPAECQQLTIEAEGGKQVVLAKSEIESLPHVKLTVPAAHDADTPVTYEGVALKSLLEKAGVQFGHSLKGRRMALCLLVEAADEYRVVIALPEIDSDFTNKQVVLAFSQNGKPLDAKEGPYRIVIPDEKRMARWVKQVTTLKIVEVQ